MFASKNDRQDESLTGEAHDQAGQCPLAGRYFEPCIMQLIVDFTCFLLLLFFRPTAALRCREV